MEHLSHVDWCPETRDGVNWNAEYPESNFLQPQQPTPLACSTIIPNFPLSRRAATTGTERKGMKNLMAIKHVSQNKTTFPLAFELPSPYPSLLSSKVAYSTHLLIDFFHPHLVKSRRGSLLFQSRVNPWVCYTWFAYFQVQLLTCWWHYWWQWISRYCWRRSLPHNTMRSTQMLFWLEDLSTTFPYPLYRVYSHSKELPFLATEACKNIFQVVSHYGLLSTASLHAKKPTE